MHQQSQAVARVEPAEIETDVDRYIRHAFDQLAAAGFIVTLRRDLDAWVRLVESTGHSVNLAFHPQVSEIRPTHCFWMDVRRKSGELAACIADRLFETDDYIGLMCTGHLWMSDPNPHEFAKQSCLLEHKRNEIRGRVGHHGGLLVFPEWRGQGLARKLTHLTRAISIAQWDVDWHCGITFGHLADAGYPKRVYGYTDMALCIDGYFAALGADARIYMTSIDKRDMLR